MAVDVGLSAAEFPLHQAVAARRYAPIALVFYPPWNATQRPFTCRKLGGYCPASRETLESLRSQSR